MARGCCLYERRVTEDEFVDLKLLDIGDDDVPMLFGVLAVF